MPDAKPTAAPDRIFVNGSLAFAPGDPVPADHAKRLGLGRRKSEGPIFATADETGITSVAGADEAAEAKP